MADLAFGISKTAVQLLAEKVKSALKEEAEQWQTVQRDLVFITGEFEMMQSFLDTADGERIKNHVVRTWLRQVRNLSFDVEDCIEFVLHLDTKRAWWLRVLPSCGGGKEESALPVDEAVCKMKQLKARVEDVSQRNRRYRFLGDPGSKSLTQKQIMSGSAIGAPGFDLLVEARDTAARCKGAVDLTKLVTKEGNDLQVISVWGTGDDLGTMSVIRNMYDDPRILENFRCRAWVKVMHPINLHEFMRSLVVQFYANSCQEQEATVSIDPLSWIRLKLEKKRNALSWTETSTGNLVNEFVRQVNTHRYLIILEDLSTIVQWDAIRPYLRDNNKRSRIVVSTRHHEIASLCTGKPYRVSELQRFSPNQSICVFFNEGSENRMASGILPTRKSVELWLNNNRLVGRDSEVEKIFNLVMARPHTDKPHVISVWGIPGCGRTAIVTNVCYRSHLMPYFDWCWTVNMSQPYNLKGFCRCLVNDYSGSVQTENYIPLENVIEQCRELLHQKRFLIVIDDVRSKEDWDMIKAANLISAKSESCIVVITTEENVAVHCAGADELVCSIKCLQATAAFDLFQQAFYQEQESENIRYYMEEQESQSNGNLFEEVGRFIFEQEEQAFQNDGDSFEGQVKVDGDSFQEEALQSDGNSFQEEALQSDGNSFEEQSFQKNARSFEEQASQNNGTLFQEKVFHNNGNFEEQPLEGRAFQDNGNSFEEQGFQNIGNSIEEQIFQNNGDSIEQTSRVFAQTDKQKEQAFRKKECSLEDYSYQNSINSCEEKASQNSEISFADQTFNNIENLFEENTFRSNEETFEKQSFHFSGSLFEEESFQNSGNLFQELLFQNNKSMLEEDTYSISPDDPNIKAILSRTGGLPQVIVALGRYLSKQRMSMEWQCQHLLANFMQELQTNPQFDCLRGILAWMSSYFWSCPPSLMRCMLYLLIFPRGQTFRRRRLVRRWIAEGYAKGTECNRLDEFVGEHFHKLASESVLQLTTPTTMEARYQANGFFHEYIISRPMEEKIFFPVEVSVLEEGYCRLTTDGVGQHLAIWSSWDRNRIVFDSLDFLRLRSLTVFGQWKPFFISDRMVVLRVLDLEDASDVSNDDVEQIGKVLLCLKFLSLRGCNQITNVVPLGGLRQLQTLDIRRTSVSTLPVSLTKLQKLQYVRAGTVESLRSRPQEAALTMAVPSLSTPLTRRPATLLSRFRLLELKTRSWKRVHCSNGGVKVLGGIGKMVALHTLGVIDVSVASGRATLEELKNLTQLRKVGVSGVKRENCQELCSAISCHTYLESFSVWFDKGMNRAGCLDGICPPPVKLQSLKLYGLVGAKLPTWVKLLTNLGKLNLQMTMIPQDEIDVLGSLTKLRALCLHFKEFQCGELDFCRGFVALQLLEIACNSRSQAVTFHAEAMHNLEVLNLPCNNVPSTLRFSGIGQLRKLKEISLSGFYDDELKQQLHSQLREHPREPVLKVDPRSF